MSASIKIRSTITLGAFVFEIIGEIPIYSLHRIKNLIKKERIQISQIMESLLLQKLIKANRDYRKESGNNWNCLTSIHLFNTINDLDEELNEMIIKTEESLPAENVEVISALIKHLQENRKKTIKQIKDWFSKNHNSLLYDMGGKIPWAIVQRLGRSLSVWVVGVNNPFDVGIREAILEVAKDENIDTDNAEDAWVKLGGSLFKGKKKDV